MAVFISTFTFLERAPATCFTIRYDTIEEINVDSKAEYTA